MARFDRLLEILHARGDIDFMLILGDLMWPGAMDDLKALLGRVDIPVYMFYGNNDIPRLGEYEASFGPRDSTFEHKGCLFVLFWDCLPEDSFENHVGDISDRQWEWIEAEIVAGRQRGVQHVFLASHVPPTCPNGYYAGFYLRDEAQKYLWDLCERHQVTACFFGHLHQDDVFGRNGTEMIVTPSLNWNFVPPGETGKASPHAWEIVDEGFFRVVQVRHNGISHALVPVSVSAERRPGRP